MQSASELPQDLKPQRGGRPRMFGVALIGSGALESRLSWRAGNAIEDFYMGLIAAGLFFLVIGQVRRRSE